MKQIWYDKIGLSDDTWCDTVYLLHSEFMSTHRYAVDKLHSTPESMEFYTLIYMHHTIAGKGAPPDRIIEVTTDSGKDNFKHRQAAAETFFGQ